MAARIRLTYLNTFIAPREADARPYAPINAYETAPSADYGFLSLGLRVRAQDEQGPTSTLHVDGEDVQCALRLRAAKHVLLTGKPGSGKSTALEMFALDAARIAVDDDRAPVPVLVRLRRYRHSMPRLVCDALAEHGWHWSPDTLDDELEATPLLLLFDGINELPNADARHELAAFRRRHRATSMVFTSRDGLALDADLATLVLQPLSAPQMRRFVNAYLPQNGSALLRSLTPRLRDMAATPLLLLMLCSAFRETGKLPDNLAIVFRRFAEAYERGLELDLAVDSTASRWWAPMLAYLAYTMLDAGGQLKPRLSVERSIAQQWCHHPLLAASETDTGTKAIARLDELIRHHLLQLVGSEVEYRHQLIQEYFAAEWWLSRLAALPNAMLRDELLNRTKWTEVLALAMGLLDDESLAERVIRIALGVDLVLAARLAGAAPLAWHSRTVALLIARIEGLPPAMRAYLLRATRSPAAVPLLAGAVEDPTAEVRRIAVEGLGEIGGAGAVKSLAIAAANHIDLSTRSFAINALGETGHPDAVQPLIALLNIALLNDDADIDRLLRRAAVQALGRLGSSRAIAALVRSLHDVRYTVGPGSIAEALADAGGPAALEALRIAAIDERDPWLRRAGLHGLELIGGSGAYQALSALAMSPDQGTARDAAARLLRLDPRDLLATKVFEEALQHASAVNAKIIIKELIYVPNDAARGLLLRTLDHPQEAIRRLAEDMLANLNGEPQKLQLHQVRSAAVRQAIDRAKALGFAPGEVLSSLLRDKRPFVRRELAREVASHGGVEHIAALIDVARDVDDLDLLERAGELQQRLGVYDPRLEGRMSVSRGTAASPALILHLSDLHFGTANDAETWHTQLAEDLRRELGCDRLDAVILSGDIANRATAAEFAAASMFLDRLAAEFGLDDRSRIVIVPGNHDLCHSASRKAYRKASRKRFEAAPLSERLTAEDGSALVRDEARYRERFTAFAKFYAQATRLPYPLDPAQQATLHRLDHIGVLVLGLNSAHDIDHHYTVRAAISPTALSRALDALRAQGDLDGYLKIAVWHHPLASAGDDRITDHGFIEQLAKAGFRVALHGHIHKAQNTLYRYDQSESGRRIAIVGAGTFGAPTHEWVPGYPLQYQLLTLEGVRLQVDTRRREEGNGAWKPDARWTSEPGSTAHASYTIEVA